MLGILKVCNIGCIFPTLIPIVYSLSKWDLSPSALYLSPSSFRTKSNCEIRHEMKLAFNLSWYRCTQRQNAQDHFVDWIGLDRGGRQAQTREGWRDTGRRVLIDGAAFRIWLTDPEVRILWRTLAPEHITDIQVDTWWSSSHHLMAMPVRIIMFYVCMHVCMHIMHMHYARLTRTRLIWVWPRNDGKVISKSNMLPNVPIYLLESQCTGNWSFTRLTDFQS